MEALQRLYINRKELVLNLVQLLNFLQLEKFGVKLTMKYTTKEMALWEN